MRLFFSYLRSKWRTIGACALFSLMFFLSFTLYRLPLAAVAYPVGLCLVLGLALLIFDFLRVRRDCETLRRIRSAAGVNDLEMIAVQRPVEAEYRALIGRLLDEHEQMQAAFSDRYARMTDYYTLWAHQIKTPIAAMRLQLQSEDTDASRACLLELSRVEQYVEMVMAYLRLDSNTTDYLFRACELDAVIRAAIKKFAGEFISRRIGLVYAPVHARVVTDEKWLQFVLEQLISNALKYTPAGSVTIRLEAPATLVIEDTGIGIAPEDLPRIFERGFTGCNGRADKKASGLGLYLCARVCKNLGHGLRAESAPGRGTRVYLNLSQSETRFE